MKHLEKGFTLVELAISIMVIGLLIGGVLKGQDLIETARSVQAAKQINAVQTAVKIFQAKYEAWPGDMRNPADFLPNCTTDPCNISGNNDDVLGATGIGWLGMYAIDTTAAIGENRNFWVHLAKLDMISGVDADAVMNTPYPGEGGVQVPGMPIKKAILTVGQFGNFDGSRSGNVMIVRYQTDSVPFALTPAQALYIDTKLDDGKPETGNINVTGNVNYHYPHTACETSNVYTEAEPGNFCNIEIIF